MFAIPFAMDQNDQPLEFVVQTLRAFHLGFRRFVKVSQPFYNSSHVLQVCVVAQIKHLDNIHNIHNADNIHNTNCWFGFGIMHVGICVACVKHFGFVGRSALHVHDHGNVSFELLVIWIFGMLGPNQGS